MQAKEPFCGSCDCLVGTDTGYENRAQEFAFYPSQQQKAVLGHAGNRLRNKEAPRPQSMAPEFSQGVINLKGLIFVIEFAEQSPMFHHAAFAFDD
jgi:hypothetical protein